MLLGLAALISVAQAYRIAIVTDMHVNPTYNETCSTMCEDLAKYGKDPSASLLNLILEDLAQSYDKDDDIKAILISGDLVRHGLSQKNMSASNWDLQKPIIQSVIDAVNTRFPGVPIISNIGNNDAINHYQAPNGTKKDIFYPDLYSIWFSTNPSMSSDP